MSLKDEVRSLLTAQRRDGFSGFPGASVRFSIPLRESVVNDLLAAARADRVRAGKAPGPSVRIRLIDNGFEARGLPLIGSMAFDLPERIDFPADPVLRLTPHGFLGRLIGSVIGALGLASEYLRMDGAQIRIDLTKMATTMGHADLVPLLQPIRLRPLPGVLWLEGEIRVRE